MHHMLYHRVDRRSPRVDMGQKAENFGFVSPLERVEIGRAEGGGLERVLAGDRLVQLQSSLGLQPRDE